MTTTVTTTKIKRDWDELVQAAAGSTDCAAALRCIIEGASEGPFGTYRLGVRSRVRVTRDGSTRTDPRLSALARAYRDGIVGLPTHHAFVPAALPVRGWYYRRVEAD
jgi:hypothetical protein